MAGSNGYANVAALKDTDWVAAHLGRPQGAPDRSRRRHAPTTQGHIAGAVGSTGRRSCATPAPRHPIARGSGGADGRSGVDNDTPIVFYGDNNNWFAAFAYWLLKLYGHQNVRSDGRRAREVGWTSSGDMTTEMSPRRATHHLSRSRRRIAPAAPIALARPDAVDQRGHAVSSTSAPPRSFRGEVIAPEHLPEEGAQRGGHIPGAKNVPWARRWPKDGTFKSAEDLSVIYGFAGEEPRHPGRS